jgi:hypothetical protein
MEDRGLDVGEFMAQLQATGLPILRMLAQEMEMPRTAQEEGFAF